MSRPRDTETSRVIQRQAFGELVDRGVYSLGFEHSPDAKVFFAETIVAALATSGRKRPTLSILECGCGTGAWLALLPAIIEPAGYSAQYYGFDLTPEMVDLARRKLAPRVPPEQLHVGDVLEDDSYLFPRAPRHFDLIYAYDLIQQLPSSSQLRACEIMSRRLVPGGALVLFDHDRRSLYGLRMGAKKFLTRYLGLKLVPSFYCNARYPALGQLSRRLAQRSFVTGIRVAKTIPKRVLIVRAVLLSEPD